MKKFFKLLMFIFLFSCFVKTVKAENKVFLSSPTMEVENGKTITVLLDFDLDKNCYVSSAILSYDNNIFESINQSNFILENNSTFSDVIYNDTNKMFVLTNSSGDEIKEQLKIKLKVKSSAKTTKTTISLNSVKLSDGSKETDLNDEKIEITVQNRNDKVVKENEVLKKSSVENKKVSRHGSFKIIILVFLAILLVILMTIYNVIYDNIPIYSAFSNKIGINTLLFLGILICAFLAVYFKNSRGDVNNDTKTDYNDTLAIINYVLDIKNEDSNKNVNENKDTKEIASNMDINHDGMVSIKDAALTIKKAKKNNYSVSLNNIRVNNNLINKNESFKIRFNANVKPYILIKYVYINNIKYNVIKLNKNEYEVLINGLSKTGINKLTINKVILDNKKIYQVNNSVNVDILKDKPVLTDKKITKIDNNVNISFNLKDNENTIKNGYLVILNQDKEVFRSNIKKGFNSYSISLEENQNYIIKVLVDYDLNSDINIDYQNILLLNEEVSVLKKEQLNIEDIYIPKVVYDKLVITFKSNLDVSKVIINGQLYSVFKTDNLYKIEIDNLTLGKQSINIEKFILSDNQEVDFNQKYEFDVMKHKPTLEILSTDEDVLNHTLKVNFKLTDIDNVVSNLKANLKSNDTIIDRKSIDLKTNEVVFEIKDNNTYKIEFIITYSLDGNNILEEVISTKDLSFTKIEDDNIVKDESENIDQPKEAEEVKEDKINENQKIEENQKNEEEKPKEEDDKKTDEEVLVNQITEDEKKKRFATL